MTEKKRDQHYVFQAYLKNWANGKSGKLWCLRAGKIFDVKPRNIAFEKDFYRIKSLNEKEIEFIKLFFHKYGDAFNKEIEKFLALYTMVDKIERNFEQLRGLLPKDCDEADEVLQGVYKDTDIAKNNLMEDVYASFEGESVIWMQHLCDQNIDFFYNEIEEREKFVNFVCMQYYRTVVMKNNILPVLEEAEEKFVSRDFPQGCLHAENLVIPMLWIISARCSDAIMKFPLTLLVNKTGVPFITSDQPVINTKADYRNLTEPTKELVFYYPISPSVAILLNDEGGEKKKELTNAEEVNKYNDLIVRASNKMIFSSDSTVLERYKSKV